MGFPYKKIPGGPMTKILYHRLPTVQNIFGGISKSYVYKLIAEGKFPRPVKLGPRTSAWRAADIEGLVAIINAQVEEENKKFGGNHE